MSSITDDPIPGGHADCVVETRHEHGFEDLDQFHTIGHDAEVAVEDDALESLAAIDLAEEAGVWRWPRVAIVGKHPGGFL